MADPTPTPDPDPLAAMLYDAPTVCRALGVCRQSLWRFAHALSIPLRHGRQGPNPRTVRLFTRAEFASLVSLRAHRRLRLPGLPP
jgi:hypothetical protein